MNDSKNQQNKWKLPRIPIYGGDSGDEIIGFQEFKWEYCHDCQIDLVDNLPSQQGHKFLSIVKTNSSEVEHKQWGQPLLQIVDGHLITEGAFPRQIVEIILKRYEEENPDCNAGKQKLIPIFKVFGYDKYDNVWFEITSTPVLRFQAQQEWNNLTKNGTQYTKYEDGTYYDIRQVGTCAIEEPGRFNSFGEPCCGRIVHFL